MVIMFEIGRKGCSQARRWNLVLRVGVEYMH
jgi:hypothetical protein